MDPILEHEHDARAAEARLNAPGGAAQRPGRRGSMPREARLDEDGGQLSAEPAL